MTERAAYIVQADGWIAGVPQRRNDVVHLTPAQAQFENVRPDVPDAPAPTAPKHRPRKPRAPKSGGQS
jgi:hypothetical protein